MSVGFRKRLQSEMQQRTAEVVGVDVNARTVELAFSSEAEVSRWFGIEILSHGAESCDLSRLNDGGAVLDGHNWSKQVGVIEKAWIDSDYVGRARVRFSRSKDGQEMLQDVADGVRRHVSVGYNIGEMKNVSNRDGVDVYLVTRWTPYEISIVPIPADPSVGVGRSADDSARPLNLTRNTQSMQNENRSLVQTIRSLMAEAENAQSHVAHTPVGFQDPTAYIPTSIARSMLACLSGESLVGLFDSEGRLRRTPNAAPSSDVINLDAAVIANSRVASAGAHVLVYPEAGIAHAVGKTGAIAMETIPGAVKNVEAATFETIDMAPVGNTFNTVGMAAGGSVTAIPRPIHVADIDWQNCIAKAVRFEIPRSDRRKYADPDQLAGEIITSIILGLSRAADEVLLSAIAATTPDAFTLAQVAAQDVRFGELRALVGTDGTGAQVNQSGSLRVDGVPADLTPDMAGTIVGAFNRATIGIKEDVTIIFERTGTAGALACTAWASFLPLLPDSNKFWTVA